MLFRTPLLVLSFLLSAFAPLFASTYYVSPGGNDLFPGTSTFFPWASIAQVNRARLQAGDQVLFVRGGTWRETLTPQTSGVYYGAYGSGSLPVISGADLLGPSLFPFSPGWRCAGSNIWSIPLASAPTQVWFNGVLGTPVSSTSAILAPLQWSYSTNSYGQSSLYVYSTRNPSQAYTAPGIEAAQRSYALSINNISSIKIENLAFVNAASNVACLCNGNTGKMALYNDVFSGAFYDGIIVLSGYPDIQTTEIKDNGWGLIVLGGSGFNLYESLISGSFNNGVYVSNTTGGSTIWQSTITGNATHNPQTQTIDNLSGQTLYVWDSIILPNPYEPKVFNYAGLTNAGYNVFASPQFKSRPAPLIVVPFVDDYINLGVAQAVSAVAHSYGCHLSYALNTKLLTPAAWSTVATMVASGDEVVAHTRSHSDLANNSVFAIQYTGPASAARMTINQSTGLLQTFLNGSSTPDLSLNISDTYNGVIDVMSRIPAGSPYSVTIQPNQNFFTPYNLANVSQVDIKSTPYMAQASAGYLTWEVEGALSDIQSNLPGYTPHAFATPYTSSNLTVENHIRNAGFLSNRNGLLTSASLPDGNWLFSNLDVYNMAAEWLPYAYDATNPASSVGALVEGLGAAGGVMTVYAHGYDEFTLQNWSDFFTNLKNLNATCMTMSQANAYVRAQGQLVPDGTNKNWVQTVPIFPSFAISSQSPSAGATLLQ